MNRKKETQEDRHCLWRVQSFKKEGFAIIGLLGGTEIGVLWKQWRTTVEATVSSQRWMSGRCVSCAEFPFGVEEKLCWQLVVRQQKLIGKKCRPPLTKIGNEKKRRLINHFIDGLGFEWGEFAWPLMSSSPFGKGAFINQIQIGGYRRNIDGAVSNE